MAPSAPPFDEDLLSGYLDGTLSHRDMQRIRIHLEDSPDSRRQLEEMRLLRQAALTTQFLAPDDGAWPELPRTPSSWISRSLGWFVLCTWLVVVCGLALWRFLSQTGDPLEIFIVLGMPGAFVLLFFSVLLDRIKSLKDDPYRGVHR